MTPSMGLATKRPGVSRQQVGRKHRQNSKEAFQCSGVARAIRMTLFLQKQERMPTIKAIQEHCGVAYCTAKRWRSLYLQIKGAA